MNSLRFQVSSLRFKEALCARLTSDFNLQPSNYKLRSRGVSLVEMIVVIAITGILAAAVAVFIKTPVEGYVDAVRRADLTDLADTALRRMTRDVRTALPNSLRVTTSGNVQYLEYLQTGGGGRYRADVTSGGGGDILDFTTADLSFDVIGPMPALAAGNSIVVYNLNADPAITTSNAYAGDNRANYSGNTATTITLTVAKLFPFASPGKRFQVVQTPVTFACDPLPSGTGELRRVNGYAIQTAQPNNINASPLSTAPMNVLLALNVQSCAFSYASVSQRTGLLALSLTVASGGESVQLFQQVHVNNVP